jgi:DNA-binding response OmpR family regulator
MDYVPGDSRGDGGGLIHLAPWVAVDRNRYAVVRRGRPPVPLTALEWRVLAVLMKHQGHVVSSEQLIVAGWIGEPRAPQDLYVVISRLRQLLERRPHQPELLVTRRGFGYLLQPVGHARPWPFKF